MSNEIETPRDPMAEFQEKVTERLRENIGEFLPDEALTKMVERAVEETFFKPRMVETGPYYSSQKEERPSWFVTAITNAARPLIEKQVEAFIQERKSLIEKTVSEYLSDNRLTVEVAKQIGSVVGSTASQALFAAAEDLRNRV